MDSGASDDDDQQRGEPPPHYAAHLDDRDRAYVAGLLRNREPLTDATLSCPSCFTTVCYECQRCGGPRRGCERFPACSRDARHVAYPTQYRALVSVHTRVLYDKALLYQVPPEVRLRRPRPSAVSHSLTGGRRTRTLPPRAVRCVPLRVRRVRTRRRRHLSLLRRSRRCAGVSLFPSLLLFL